MRLARTIILGLAGLLVFIALMDRLGKIHEPAGTQHDYVTGQAK